LSGLSVKPGATGGGETVLRHLVRYLPAVNTGLELVVYTDRRNREVFETPAAAVELHTADVSLATPLARVTYEMLVLPRLLRRHRIDIFLGVNQVLPPALPCPGVSLLQNELYYRFHEFCTPAVVGWRQSLRLHLRFAYYHGANDRSLRRACRGVSVSQSLRRLASDRAGVPAERIDVVPLAPSDELTSDVHLDAPVAGVECDLPVFLVLGAITPYKNIERAIDAVAMLRRRASAVQLAIVGWDVWGYAQRLRTYADALDVADRVTFVGPVSHRETGTYYRSARALLMLSTCEAFPLPVVEAMRCGTPVIGSNRSGVREAVGTGGAIVDPDDIAALAAEMEAVATSESRHAELVAAGSDWVSQYSWERTAREISQSLYKGLES
jgi:glycosyltransferase involved in cell wall biosynthesis